MKAAEGCTPRALELTCGDVVSSDATLAGAHSCGRPCSEAGRLASPCDLIGRQEPQSTVVLDQPTLKRVVALIEDRIREFDRHGPPN